ncbi:MAG: hypothetical protein ABI553_00860 [Chloroflexota bacterium]
MNLTAARLTLRLTRFELLAFGGFILAFIVLTVLAAARIDSLRPPPECLSVLQDASRPVSCEVLGQAWYDAQNGLSGLSVGLLLFLSFAAGLFLGVPIVAREVERGTSRLAWSLAPSRMRWFLARMLPILVAVAVLTFVAGIAVDRYVGAVSPNDDLANSFTSFGFRGLLVASRAVFIFAVGVAVGAIIARALPAVILTAVIASIGLAGGERVHQMILASEAVAIPMDQNDNGGVGRTGDLFIDQRFVLPDGSLVGWQYFNGEDPYDQFGNPKYPMVAIVVPGDRFRFVETREALALAGGSLVALVLAGFVVSRRRPG